MGCGCGKRRSTSTRKYEVVVNGRVRLETADKQRAIAQARTMKGSWREKRQ